MEKTNEEKILLAYLGLNLYERVLCECARTGGNPWTVVRNVLTGCLPERNDPLNLDFDPYEVANEDF